MDISNKCSCGKTFKCRSSLYKHCKRSQNCSPKIPEGSTKCGENNCPFSCLYIQDLRDHLKSAHDVENVKIEKQFKNYQEFELWKEGYEKETVSSFLKRKTTKVTDKTNEYFYCNRSGQYTSKSTGKRVLKSQGSLKSGHNCTAAMKVTINNTGTVSAEVWCTHYGHENQLCHIRISKTDREEIAGRLIDGVSRKHILNVFANSVPKIDRLHLIDRNDVRNIASAYGVEQRQRHKEDHLSVEEYISELLTESKETVLLYKRLHENTLAYPENEESPFKKKDFALGLMTESQAMMLKKFGSNMICIDSTHGTNGNDVKLITVMVVDEDDEAIPVIWFLCNREDESSLRFLFKRVQQLCGNITTKFLMTNGSPQFSNSWTSVFGGQSTKLLCVWHIYKDWSERLVSIHNESLRDQILNSLRLIQEETDAAVFEILMQKFLEELTDNEQTAEFGNYFQYKWVDKKSEWATCYRMGARINTNTFQENFNKNFKYYYLDGKYNKCLDKCIAALLDFACDHTVKRNQKQRTYGNEIEMDQSELVAEADSDKSNEIEMLLKDINTTKPSGEADKLKQVLCQKLDSMKAKIAVCQDLDQLVSVQKHIYAATAVLSLKQTRKKKTFISKQKVNENQKIQKQRRIISTVNRKNKQTKHSAKPNCEQKIESQNHHLDHTEPKATERDKGDHSSYTKQNNVANNEINIPCNGKQSKESICKKANSLEDSKACGSKKGQMNSFILCIVPPSVVVQCT